jgi:single-stranded-DNA-specific exonuclease
MIPTQPQPPVAFSHGSTPLVSDTASVQPEWRPKPADPEYVATLAVHLACPPSIARILASRGIATPSSADAFLNPSINQLHNPAQLLGVQRAVERILSAILAAEPVLIYGDYDVDGTTATVLLKTTIERIGLALNPPAPQNVTFHVPHRIREGYGMQSSVLALAAAEGIRLVISVDTGIRAIAEAAEARALGLDLIVTDHHLPNDQQIPACLAVINPAQPNCPYPDKHLCGAAVAFKLAHALLLAAAPLTADPAAFTDRTNRVLLPSFLKLVAIATIADSVPLTGENRAIAAIGLAALANPIQPGLRSLMHLAKLPLDRAPTAMEVGFRLAPRINAAGRMDIASDVVELFLTRDRDRAHELAVKLDSLNTARRDSEARALTSIDEELAALLTRSDNGSYPADCLILDHPDWHRGVLGILASRVVDRTARPALVITHANGDAHGSGRSIPGFHLLDAITAAHNAEAAPLFHRFGGHAHAVGFSLPSDRLPLLRARINSYAPSRLTTSLLIPPLNYDAELTLADITPALFTWLARLAPFGIGNPEPLFLTRNVTLAAPIRLIQEKHVCLQLTHPTTDPQSTTPAISALGWSRGSDTSASSSWPARCAQLALTAGSIVDIVYRIKFGVKQNTGPYANSCFAGLELRDLRLAAGPASPSPPDAAL